MRMCLIVIIPIPPIVFYTVVMYQRKELTKRIIKDDGSAINVRFMDGLVIEDVLLQLVQAFAYKQITGVDVKAPVKRQLKDYLIKLYTIS